MGASHFLLEAKVFQLECEVFAGNGQKAVAAAAPVFELAAEVGDPLLEAMLLRSKAWAHFEQGEYDEAEELADRCLSVAEGIGAAYEVGLALVIRGQVRAATGGDRRPDHTRAA